MRAYVLTSFVLGVVGLFLMLLKCGIAKWPYKSEIPLGLHVAEMVIKLAFVFWAAIVLWL